MSRMRQAGGVVCLLVLVAGACTHAKPQPKPPPSIRRFPVGGTLRVGVPAFNRSTLSTAKALDPQKDYFADSWEVLRCCLLRTLISYLGVDTAHGGAVARPDLASNAPTVSSDGLTWTFHLRRGLHYAPPSQAVTITTPDVIRALEREGNTKASEGGYSFYYSVIAGFDDYASGTADSISGLQAPDPYTLQVHLTHPEGDLSQLFSLPATAPIPPNPSQPSAPVGVATGHDDGYGQFLVSSGPYMIEGSDRLDFSKPPPDQTAVAGYTPGKSLVLVRNPSWRTGTDPLRPAYVDRIELSLGGSLDEDSASIDSGGLDLVMFPGPYPQAPLSQVDRYRRDPSLGTVVVQPRDFLRYVSMNIAVPPLDDIHVRKAINFAVDKAAARDALGGPDAAEIIGHIVLNSLENNLLLNYDPYGSPGDHGDLVAARREMALSKYDLDHDGLCDAAVCDGLEGLVFDIPPFVKAGDAIAASLAGIGIKVRVRPLPRDNFFAIAGDPKRKWPLALTVAWGKDIPSASNYFQPLFSNDQIETQNNLSLVGATPDQLRGWGYSVTQVPNIDAQMAACVPLSGDAAFRCWSDLDQYVMKNVVPWVPYMSDLHLQIVPRRILHFSYDEFADMPSLDQIALRSSGS